MNYKILLMIILVVAVSFPAQAEDFELALGDDSIQLSYLTRSTLLGSNGHDLNYGILLTENRDIVGSVGLMLPGVLAATLPKWFSIGVGAKGYFSLLSDPQDAEIFSLSPGVEARLTMPIKKIPMHLVASFFYAPKITTFGDADDLYDTTVRYEVDFASSAVGFIGYRLLRYELEGDGGHQDVDEGLHIGFRVAF